METSANNQRMRTGVVIPRQRPGEPREPGCITRQRPGRSNERRAAINESAGVR